MFVLYVPVVVLPFVCVVILDAVEVLDGGVVILFVTSVDVAMLWLAVRVVLTGTDVTMLSGEDMFSVVPSYLEPLWRRSLLVKFTNTLIVCCPRLVVACCVISPLVVAVVCSVETC